MGGCSPPPPLLYQSLLPFITYTLSFPPFPYYQALFSPPR